MGAGPDDQMLSMSSALGMAPACPSGAPSATRRPSVLLDRPMKDEQKARCVVGPGLAPVAWR